MAGATGRLLEDQLPRSHLLQGLRAQLELRRSRLHERGKSSSSWSIVVVHCRRRRPSSSLSSSLVVVVVGLIGIIRRRPSTRPHPPPPVHPPAAPPPPRTTSHHIRWEDGGGCTEQRGKTHGRARARSLWNQGGLGDGDAVVFKRVVCFERSSPIHVSDRTRCVFARVFCARYLSLRGGDGTGRGAARGACFCVPPPPSRRRRRWLARSRVRRRLRVVVSAAAPRRVSAQVLDRVSFDGSSMQGALFNNAVLSGTSFDGANVRRASRAQSSPNNRRRDRRRRRRDRRAAPRDEL